MYKVFLFIITGSSSFESQKMDRPSISVTSPMSPGMLRDVPQFLSGQLSVCKHFIDFNVVFFAAYATLTVVLDTEISCYTSYIFCLMLYISV